jgi:hypothetical protein
MDVQAKYSFHLNLLWNLVPCLGKVTNINKCFSSDLAHMLVSLLNTSSALLVLDLENLMHLIFVAQSVQLGSYNMVLGK